MSSITPSKLLLLAAFAQSVRAERKKGDPIAGYVPAIAPALIFGLLFGAMAALFWVHFFRMGRKFILVLPIATSTLCLGYLIRIATHSNNKIGPYIFMQLCILLSPCGFLAVCYILLGRIAMFLGDEVSRRCLILNARKISTIFVWSDIITLFIQGGGSNMGIIQKPLLQTIAKWVVIVGFVLQLLSFSFFLVVFIQFGQRIKVLFPHLWHDEGAESTYTFSFFGLFNTRPVYRWRFLYNATMFASVGILIRCIFRTVEFSAGGATGYIATHEAFSYVFDSLPLFLAMSIYIWVWPAKFLPVDGARDVSLAIVRTSSKYSLATEPLNA